MTKYLEKDDFKEYIKSDILYKPNKKLHDYANSIWSFENKKRFLVLKRTGKCEPNKCDSICCKLCSAGYITDYSKGFFDCKDDFGYDILKRKCNNLSKCGKCDLWGKKIPNACKQFPHPSDSIYWNVIDVCTFRYEILWEIKKTSDRTRKEMIECFKQYNDDSNNTKGSRQSNKK